MNTSITPTTSLPRPAASVARSRFDPWRALKRSTRTPKGLMIQVLLGLLLLGGWVAGYGVAAPALLAAVGTAAALDTVLLWLTRGKWQWPSGAVLSALFVALILDPRTPAYIVACTAVLAITSKYLLRSRWANICNPAALALVANYFLFGSGQSWWGALPDLPIIFVGVLLVAVAYIANHIKKLPMVLAFLGTFFGAATVLAFVKDPTMVAELFRTPDLQMALFFAGFMLTDPPTSPAKPRDQIIYGIVVAALALVFFRLVGAVWFLPGALLIGNLGEALRRFIQQRPATRRVATRQA